MSDKKERNTIITDWLEKHGDPEIDKKVEERLEQITREIMSNKKQSSVDWFNNELEHLLNTYGFISKKMLNIHFNRAKTMHKEEVIDAWCDGFDEDNRASSNPYMYYNETFGGQDNE